MNQNVECEEKTIINPEVVQAMRDKLMDERSIMRLVEFYT